MKNRVVAAVLALLFMTCGPQAKAGSMEGAGATLCVNVSETHDAQPSVTEDLYFGWAQGFMSGLNIAKDTDDTMGFKSMPREDQKSYIRKFCGTYPDKKYVEAVIDLYLKLYPTPAKAK